eukprot:504336_1
MGTLRYLFALVTCMLLISTLFGTSTPEEEQKCSVYGSDEDSCERDNDKAKVEEEERRNFAWQNSKSRDDASKEHETDTTGSYHSRKRDPDHGAKWEEHSYNIKHSDSSPHSQKGSPKTHTDEL